MKEVSLVDLFISLASPNALGVSRVCSKLEFVNEYSRLYFTNGCNWMRGLKGRYKYRTSGKQSNWTIQLIGIDDEYSNRSIRKDIFLQIKSQKCVHTGFNGTTQNEIECDHKNGRYNNINVLDPSKQKISDFQPLCRQANLQKRSDCKSCSLSGIRFDAKSLGYQKSVIKGTLEYKGDCDGCYWYNPFEFKKSLF